MVIDHSSTNSGKCDQRPSAKTYQTRGLTNWRLAFKVCVSHTHKQTRTSKLKLAQHHYVSWCPHSNTCHQQTALIGIEPRAIIANSTFGVSRAEWQTMYREPANDTLPGKMKVCKNLKTDPRNFFKCDFDTEQSILWLKFGKRRQVNTKK